MNSQPLGSRGVVFSVRTAGALALSVFLGVGVKAQGTQQRQEPPPQPTPQSAQAPEQQPKPKYAPQDADKPPYSNDRPMRSAPPNQPASQGQNGPQGENGPQGQNAAPGQGAPAPIPSQQVPSTLTIPAGTILLIRTNDFLSSDHNQIGDQFTALLEQPLVVNGWVVALRGQVLTGQVKAVQKAGRVKGVSQLGVELTDMTLVDGRQVPILTELWKGTGGTSHEQDAATIGSTTALGAIIGAAADWGRGAAIGAGAGAAAGIGAVLLTRGRPTELPPETPLSFRLQDPVTVDTTKSQQAFLPVTQQDFDGPRGEHRRPRMAAGYPGPWYWPCGYYGPCFGYPAYFGVYEGFDWDRGRREFRH